MFFKILRLCFTFHSAFLDALRYTLFDDLEIRELDMKCAISPTKEEKMLMRLDASITEPNEGEQND
jgi:hypothetical protein